MSDLLFKYQQADGAPPRSSQNSESGLLLEEGAKNKSAQQRILKNLKHSEHQSRTSDSPGGSSPHRRFSNTNSDLKILFFIKRKMLINQHECTR